MNNNDIESDSDQSDSDQPDPDNPPPRVEPTESKAEPTIHLDQFLKTCGVATGGQAKRMIQGGEILVNDEIETRRRKQLRAGDEVTLDEVVYVVTLQ